MHFIIYTKYVDAQNATFVFFPKQAARAMITFTSTLHRVFIDTGISIVKQYTFCEHIHSSNNIHMFVRKYCPPKSIIFMSFLTIYRSPRTKLSIQKNHFMKVATTKLCQKLQCYFDVKVMFEATVPSTFMSLFPLMALSLFKSM